MSKNEIEVSVSGRIIAAGVAIMLTFGYGVAGYESIELNESGIQVEMLGENSGNTIEMTPGMQWVEPFSNDVFTYDTRSEQYDIPEVRAETNDGQPIVADVSLEIRLIGSKIGELHKTVGPNWYDEVVYPAARKFIRMNTSAISSDQIYTGKGKRLVSDGIQTDLAYFNERGIDITVNLRNVQFTNADFIASLEAKAVATQNEIIAKRNALAAIETAKGVENTAEGEKQRRVKLAEAGREEARLRGEGNRLEKEENAKGIEAIGRANAVSIKLARLAIGSGDNYAKIKVAEALGDNFQVWGIPTGAPGTSSIVGLDSIVGKALGATKGQ